MITLTHDKTAAKGDVAKEREAVRGLSGIEGVKCIRVL